MATGGKCRLDALPVEILEKIIAFTSCRTVLELTLVNKAFHSSCESKAIYRGLLENGNSHDRPDWDCPILHADTPTSTWKHYAMADDKAGDHFSAENYKETRWLPHLVALGHPAINRIETTDEDRPYDSTNVESAHVAAAFCVAVASLNNVISEEQMREHEGSLASCRAYFLSYYETDDLTNLGFTDLRKVVLEETYWSIWAYRALRYFFPVLRRTVKMGMPTGTWDGQTRWNGNPSYRPPRVPFVKNVPFHELMKLPLPFSHNCVEDFKTCHLPVMMSKNFIEDGDWMGCYTIESQWPDFRMEFDPPLHGIKLKVEEEIEDKDQSLLYYKGEGQDAVGIFYLKGVANVNTGITGMVKSYTNGMSWANVGVVTPLGIFTCWGDTEWDGWALLWKTSWCVDEHDAAMYTDNRDLCGENE